MRQWRCAREAASLAQSLPYADPMPIVLCAEIHFVQRECHPWRNVAGFGCPGPAFHGRAFRGTADALMASAKLVPLHPA